MLSVWVLKSKISVIELSWKGVYITGPEIQSWAYCALKNIFPKFAKLKQGIGRPIDTFLGAYNIHWNWENGGTET